MMTVPDYQRVPSFFDAAALANIETIYRDLTDHAEEVIRQAAAEKRTLAEFYHDNATLIVVPEKTAPARVCRMEYLDGSSPDFHQQITRPVQQQLEALTGEKLVLFKDKCNLKAPRGGAFPPHQDAPAYLGFGPTIFITAGIMLDALTKENGCLHMATNYRQIAADRHSITPAGDYPLFDFYDGGSRNGDIVDEVQQKLTWEAITAQAGDMLLFNSFVPHFSHINSSPQQRRVLYLTFNLLNEGEHYRGYYQKKWRDYSNPQFHISTPTAHAALSQ
ncbi:phytanoyl-CoA dioxygenase family protein [Yersinia wautersii]|uniref:Phytanoyl-CoA dioxygenase (PhyH) n=1 Tax=Yersinia wautersii TaxID=1341643 RepID=A0ABM9TCI4_9GAMM|nr:phytanoyl-CoA dioxygenase family protein [Yersinia wautersii]CRG49493.1 Phytanoyl-CoA dioxygenase (PhyH) [Yersinia wautersii]